MFREMKLVEAIELGYLRRQGRYKGAPWICTSTHTQYRTSKEALDAANNSLRAHWSGADSNHKTVGE